MQIGFDNLNVGPHPLAADANSSQLVNFPFALASFLSVGSGVVLMCAGMIGDNPCLSMSGFFFTLAGGGMYGWSLEDN